MSRTQLPATRPQRPPWNKGRLIVQKRPLQPRPRGLSAYSGGGAQVMSDPAGQDVCEKKLVQPANCLKLPTLLRQVWGAG